MPAAGYSQYVRWGNETYYGSAAATGKDLGAVQSISPGEKNNLLKIRTLGGNRDFKTVIPGKFEISGNMEYYFQGADFFRQAFGEDTATTATVDSGPKILSAGGTLYKHVMGSANSPGVNDYPSFTLELTDYEDSGALATTQNLKRTFTGCRVNTMGISGSIDEPLKCAVDWLAKRVIVSTGAATSITEYTDDPYVFYEGYVFLTSGVATAGTPPANIHNDALCQVLSFDLTINNNCEAGWYIAGTCDKTDSPRAAKFIIPKGREYDLSMALHYKDSELYRRFLASPTATTDAKTMDKFQIVLDFIRSGTPGTIAAGLKYLRFVVASATFDDMTINGAPEDIVNNDVTVFGKSVKCYAIDGTSSYSS